MTSHLLLKKKYSEDAMSRALAEVKGNTLSLRAAAKKYGVPSSSLSDRNTGKVQEGSKWGRSPILTIDQERTVIEHAMKRAELGIGFTKSSFLRFVGKFATEKGVYFKDGAASEKWWRGLKKRHTDFSLRSPEATSAGRHVAMTRKRICTYFSALKEVLYTNELGTHPERIWNMDETGLSLAHKPAKVLTKKGTKCVHSKVSCNRELVTVIACGNASGEVIPPHVILPGKSDRVLKGYDINYAPVGTNLSVSETGWTKEGIGRLWFTDTFIPNISKERPQLLIFDGHGSHNHIEFVEIARAENIILLELPSKTSHWTQPFDRTVFKALKSNWNLNIQTFMSDTGVSVGHAQFFRLLKRSWHASMTVNNISSGFVATGICPYNPGAIPNVAYAPSELYVDEETSTSTTNTTSELITTMPTTPSATPTRRPEVSLVHTYNRQEAIVSCSATTPAHTPLLLSQCSTPTTPDLLEQLTVPTTPTTPSAELPCSTEMLTSQSVSEDASADSMVTLTQPLEATTTIPSTVVSVDVVTSGQTVVDLPVKLDENGTLCMMPDDTTLAPIAGPSDSSNVTECTTDMALRVVESALTEAMKLKYMDAFNRGKELDDSLYSTWKMYYQKTSPSTTFSSPVVKTPDLFALPVQKKKTSKRKHIGQYFVISSDEAYNEMKKIKEEKELKQNQIKERKRIRELNKKEKALKKSTKK